MSTDRTAPPRRGLLIRVAAFVGLTVVAELEWCCSAGEDGPSLIALRLNKNMNGSKPAGGRAGERRSLASSSSPARR